ncbi:MAG: type I polyketide synthase, partial [Myxococcota bacterium]
MDAPLAILGIGCRLPAAIDSFDALRRALAAGRSQVRRVPADRWDADRLYHPDLHKPGHLHAVRGGFVDDVDQFDAAFFGIGPAEAARIDPQQRWILETSYRALEDAGWTLERVAGQRIAVVVGVSARDYDAVQTAPDNVDRIGPHTNTGSAASIVANRVSYTFDLRGPSFTVDTACSSSLTALHQAALAIAAGDATAALVGGVNLALRPEPTIGFSQGGYLSPDGECRAFSDHANGYVRGEGAATILIRPLADALRDGDRVWAVIRSTAVNQDGHSAGMTAPSVEAQVDLLTTAYARAGIDPREVAYLEAHGTGTPAGDPIEATAIGRVLGAGRSHPLPIGSVKTMLGHLESAAGMAGLLKLVATLSDRVLYPNLCFRAPNPRIPFDALGLRVVTEPGALPASGPLIGGVNAFGFGGANAHAVLETSEVGGRSPRAPAIPADPPTAVYFSARTASAARTLAGALADDVPDPARWVVERSSFEHRVVARGADPADLVDRLWRFAAGDDGAVTTARLRDPGQVPVAFVFGGQGPQWHGMAAGLLADRSGPGEVFGDAIDEVGDALARHGWLGGRTSALREELGRDARSSRIAETRIAQPCLFAVQVGLALVLADHGVVPAAVTGHSIGELGAAWAAGALTLDEAARLVVARSLAQADAEGTGRMAAVQARPDEVAGLLAPFGGRVEVAAFNGPATVTVAGDTDAVLALGALAERSGRFFRLLDVNVPFHCHRMDDVRARFLDLAGDVARRPGDVPFASTVTGGWLDGADLDAGYFYRNIREPVRFTDAVGTLLDARHTLFVELGPHPILRRGAEQLGRERGTAIRWVPTLVRDADDHAGITATLDALHLAGARVWPSVGGGDVLPRIPLEPVRHWNESDAARRRRTGADRTGHPHLVAATAGERGVVRAEARLDPAAEGYLADHRVQGVVVFPGAGQLELCAAILARIGDEAAFVEDLAFRMPIAIDEGGATVALEASGPDGAFVIASDRGGDRVVHTRGKLNRHGDPIPAPPVALDALQARFTDAVDVERLFADARAAGLDLGPSFRGIARFWVDGTETLARLDPPAALAADLHRYRIHPALLDAAVQTAALGTLSQAASGGRALGLFLPAGIERFRVLRPHDGGTLWCHARRREEPRTDRRGDERTDELRVDAVVVDGAGLVVVALDGLILKQVRGTEPGPRLRTTHTYAVVERPIDGPPACVFARGQRWVVLGEG